MKRREDIENGSLRRPVLTLSRRSGWPAGGAGIVILIVAAVVGLVLCGLFLLVLLAYVFSSSGGFSLGGSSGANFSPGALENAPYQSSPEAAERRKSVQFYDSRRTEQVDTRGAVGLSSETQCSRLTNFCLDSDDNILACDGSRNVVRVISGDDKLLATWQLDFSPQAIDHRDDGVTIVAGTGKIALLDSSGKVIKSASIPGGAATGIGYSGEDIFVVTRGGTSYDVWRMNSELAEQERIISKLRGCCGQMDITAKDGVVYVAANCRFRVVKYDRDGNAIGKFGEKGRRGDKFFKGCCEPKNVCFDSEGNLYTSESSHCSVKKFTTDGEFLGFMGVVRGIRGCVRVSIAVTKDRDKIYMLDTSRNIVRSIMRVARTETEESKKDTSQTADQEEQEQTAE